MINKLKNLKKIINDIPNFKLWYRDDDAGYDLNDNQFNLDESCKLITNNNIEGIIGVIPYRIFSERGQNSLKTLLEYNVPVAMHGIYHCNNAREGHKNEFPETFHNDKYKKLLSFYHKKMKETFNSNFSSIFIPPYNMYSSYWENFIYNTGFYAISAQDFNEQFSYYDIQIDIIDWGRKKYYSRDIIFDNINYFIDKGYSRIGILNHHKYGHCDMWKFLNLLFNTINN